MSTRLVFKTVQHPLLFVVGLFVLCLAILSVPAIRMAVQGLLRRRARGVVRTVPIAVIGLYFMIVAWYVGLPNFSGEVEPMIASVSWGLQQHLPLYHGLEDAERYSVLYGPMVYVFNGMFLRLFGPSVMTAKLGSAVAAVLGVSFLYLALLGVARSRIALAFTAFSVIAYSIFGPFSYFSRPDPFELSCVCFGLLCAARARTFLAVVGTAVALALSVNLKIHAGLYFLPILVLLHKRHGTRAVAEACIVALPLAIMPFAASSNISAVNYFMWLREAARHGLDFDTFWKTLRFSLLLLVPVALFATRGEIGRRLLKEHRLYIGSLMAATGGLLIFASKPGAGLTHLMPLIPLVAYLAVQTLIERRRSELNWGFLLERVRLAALIACVAATVGIAAVVQYKCVQRLWGGSQHAALVSADVSRILESYPDTTIAMAYGGEAEDYEATFARPQLIFSGQPLILDVICVMEADQSGRQLPKATYDAIASGRVAIWLVPKENEPFVKRNWYAPHERLFPLEFRQLFLDNYHRGVQSEFFDLWFWNGSRTTEGELDARVGAL